jgi:hypothetical protein
MDRSWPTAAISSAEIYTCRMAAFWTGAELSLVGLPMAACGPARQSAPREKLRDRIQQRAARNQDASDVDLAVLEHQLTHHDPLGDQEIARTFTAPALRRGSGFRLIQDI